MLLFDHVNPWKVGFHPMLSLPAACVFVCLCDFITNISGHNSFGKHKNN